jgi:hypothetical protein
MLAAQVLVAQADTFIKKGTAFFPGSSLTGEEAEESDAPSSGPCNLALKG